MSFQVGQKRVRSEQPSAVKTKFRRELDRLNTDLSHLLEGTSRMMSEMELMVGQIKKARTRLDKLDREYRGLEELTDSNPEAKRTNRGHQQQANSIEQKMRELEKRTVALREFEARLERRERALGRTTTS